MPTEKQNQSFELELQTIVRNGYTTTPLSNALYWMQQNLEPEDIFSEKQLSNWAEANGYIKE